MSSERTRTESNAAGMMVHSVIDQILGRPEHQWFKQRGPRAEADVSGAEQES